MRKYNRSEIMKRAWEIKRKLDNTISEALKMSWILAKKAEELKEDYARAYYTCSWRSKYQNNKGHYVEL